LTGRIFFILLCLVAAVLSTPVASPSGLATWGSLAASSTAFVAMALNQYLAARPRYLEPMFGGLDRMYHFHRQLGMLALVLILVHYYVTPDFQGRQLTSGLNALAKQAGEWGFYGLVALIAFSLVKKIPFTKFEVPYHLWRQSHRLIGVMFILIAFHQFFIKRPPQFTATSLLANYLLFFAALGIGSFLWTQFGAFTRRRTYTVSAINRLPAATVIDARPLNWAINARPGQFGFLKSDRRGLGEPHPFTIAGRKDDGSVRFAIKPLGDYTARLRERLEPGDRLYVEGGYGRFQHTRGGKKQLWLAGGIGITPFLAMAASLKPDEKRQIHLVHCVRDATEAVDAEMLAAKAAEVGSFSFQLFDSAASGRIDAEKLCAGAPFDLHGADLWFCGPPPLREAIVAGLRKLGKRLARIEYERFEFR
jgi:predicted ferric reductase